MSKRTIRLRELAPGGETILAGSGVRASLDDRLTRAFEREPASASDPLKIVISFEGVEDIGALVLDEMVENIRHLYSSDWYKYLTFSDLTPNGHLVGVLSALLKHYAISIVCEPEPRTFCGITEQDMTLRGGPYYSEDWRDRRIAVDYLYELGSDREASTTHVVGAIAARGLGKAAARHVLDELDDAGIAIPRSIRRSNEVVWCHVANYNPPELATK